MKRLTRIALICLMVAMVLPAAGYAAFAAVSTATSQSGTTASSDESTGTMNMVTADNIVISQEVLDQIKQSDPGSYDNNIRNYKNFLIDLNVHDKYKQEMERLVMAGHPLPHVLIAYTFLYHHFGRIDSLEPLVQQREDGASWEQIFQAYHQNHPDFVPRAFDPDVLQELMSMPDITADDIMIADQVSFVTGKPYQEIMNARVQMTQWKEINAVYGVLFSADQLPRVQITEDQMKKYTLSSGLSEDQVAQAFVLAGKLGLSAATVIDQFRSGLSEEAVFARACTDQFE